MDIILKLDTKEYRDLTSFCDLNKFEQDDVVKKSYLRGFSIEKYGLLSSGTEVVEKEIIKEVIKYIEVPVVEEKEVVKIEYVEVPVERVVEKVVEITKEIPIEKIVIKEIPVEKVVTKTEYISDNTKIDELLLKIQQLEFDKQLFSTKTEEMEKQMSKKGQELDELRRTLDIYLAKPPVEKIVEVVVEKEVTDNSSKFKLDALQNTLAKVRQETLEKDKKIKELEQTITDIQKFQDNKRAVYLKGSNLDDKLYK